MSLVQGRRDVVGGSDLAKRSQMRVASEDDDVAGIMVSGPLSRFHPPPTVECARNNTSGPNCVNRNEVRIPLVKCHRGRSGLRRSPAREKPADKFSKWRTVVSWDEACPRVFLAEPKHVLPILFGSAPN